MAKYFDEMESWLKFNERIIYESRRRSNPLMERLNFLIIANSNLDEFVKGGFDENKTREQLSHILISFVSIRRQLYRFGIRIERVSTLKEKYDDELFKLWKSKIFPLLQVQSLGDNIPLPFIRDDSEYIVTNVKDDDDESKYIVNLPQNELMKIKLDSGIYFISSSDLTIQYINTIYKGTEVRSKYFRSLKEVGNIEIDDDVNYVDIIKHGIKYRKDDAPVVMCYENNSIGNLKGLLDCTHIECFIPYGYKYLSALKDYVDNKAFYFDKFKPAHVEMDKKIFKEISKKDLLIHLPYQSFEDTMVRFIEEAASDDKVKTIKQTIYRVAKKSKIIDALCAAADKGKKVTAMVELKAKQDEEQNLKLVFKLKTAGVTVIFGPVDYKTHAKVCIVTRQEDDDIESYIAVSSGNFNESTAKIYEDIIVFTKASKKNSIDEEINNVFNYLGMGKFPEATENILVAPNSLKQRLIKEIDKCIDFKQNNPNEKCEIRLKCNGVNSKEICDKLYEASKYGIKINMIVRGTCIIVPNENIRVKSIVGRFLEHSRIYEFIRGTEINIFVGSADLMVRNLDNRVEILIPLIRENLKRSAHEILDIYEKDKSGSYYLNPNGSYTNPPEGKFSAQRYFVEQFKETEGDHQDE